MTTQPRIGLIFGRSGTASHIALALGFALAVAACSSDGGDEGDDGAGGSAGGTSSTGTGGDNSTAGSGGGSTAGAGGSTAGSGGGGSCVSCDDGCPNIPCACNDGSIVNTTYCNNGCCEPAEVACPDACSDSGGWNSGGGSTGGTGGTSNTGGSGGGTTTGNDIGGECQGDDDCLSNICLFAPGAAFGYCSKTCESFADCPSFWDCDHVGNATGTYCIQD